ncbi:electron transfer flavoprotein subunit beta/FixA family protein [Oceanobacter mangrovi]|uniref:electron transfer flavoprotein subunit beta/FixA family protein n=1 Tax=Oceanobacter mangrovi TaxID=2862510 RepID=UPI001C8D1A72|nr:electron transfer flavoprotein subunit beta/FixA family protein [Oceanobacter mangrovi]
MKILVGVKRVIDYNVQVRVRPDETDVDLSNTKMAMNPFCEIAVEEAVRLKEQGIASEIVVVSVGPKVVQEQLRLAMALGADRAIQVETEDAVDSLAVAEVFAELVAQEQPGLVLLGKQSIDSDNNQTGQMLAGMAGLGQATFASAINFKEGCIQVTREVDGGLQTLELTLPAVVTTDLRLNEPRHARLPDIMKSKKKPIDVRPLGDFNVTAQNYLKVLKVQAPAQRQAGEMVASVAELVDKLKNQAGVIA